LDTRIENCYGSSGSTPMPGSDWLTSDASVGTINSEGLAEGVSPGYVTFTTSWINHVWHFQSIDLDCLVDDIPGSGSGGMDVIPRVDKIQYQDGNSYVDISGTLFILKGTSVTFKAAPNPKNGTWPAGNPVWSGNSGASGTGSTTTVTFNSTSASISDYKAITASSGNSSVSVFAIVYELMRRFTPEDNFAQRSLEDFGVQERVNLSYSSTLSLSYSQIGNLKWKITQGLGSISNATQMNGNGTFTASQTSGNVTLELEIQSGPSKNQSITYNKTIVSPSGAYILKVPNLGLIHCYGYCSTGFFGSVYLQPANVSFEGLYFREGGGVMQAQGYYAPLNMMPHDPTPQGAIVSDCQYPRGCYAFLDTIYTGNGSGPFSVGQAIWPIEWLYGFVENPATNYVYFTTANHQQNADAQGKASIQKASSGTFSSMVNDASSENGCIR